MVERYIRFTGYFSNSIIEVSKIKNIPCDYYGCMGVPISVLDKISSAHDSQWEILDLIRPKINGKELYVRIAIRRKLPPKIFEYLDGGGVFIHEGDDLYIPLIK